MLEAQETPIDVVIPFHKRTCQGINVNKACVAEETPVFELLLPHICLQLELKCLPRRNFLLQTRLSS